MEEPDQVVVGASVEQRLVLIAVEEVHTPLVPLHYSLYNARGKQARSVRKEKVRLVDQQSGKREKKNLAPPGEGG